MHLRSQSPSSFRAASGVNDRLQPSYVRPGSRYSEVRLIRWALSRSKVGIRLIDSGPLRSPHEEARLRLVSSDTAHRVARRSRLRQSARARPRRGRVVALIASLLIIFALAGSIGVVYVRVNSLIAGFKSAEAHLEAGKSLLANGSTKRDLSLLNRARKEFEAAQVDFASAQGQVDSVPLIHVSPGIPKLGRYVNSRVSAVDNLGEMGKEIADVGRRATDIDLLLMTPAAQGQPTGSKRLLNILGEAQPSIQIIQQELKAAKAHAAAVDGAVLPGQQRAALVKAKASLEKGISGLDEFGRLLPALQDILAADGRRVYLIEQANPFELRAGGGYIGSYTLIAADHGNLQVLKSGDTHDLPDANVGRNLLGQPGYVAPPKTMLQFLSNQSWSLPDSNFFPDFATNAQAALSFSERDFGTKVDGVISMDLYCVTALLSLTGPMQVPGYNLTVDSGNLITQLIPLDIRGDPNHKKVLSALAGPLMEKLTTLGSERWPELIKVLNEQAGQRHVQLWFASDKSQPEIQRLGLSGDLVLGGRPDFLYEVESNFSGNKANFFLHRSYTLTLTRTQSALHHELTEDLLLDGRSAPPWYDVSYNGYYRLFVPGAATARRALNLTPDDYPYTNPPSGTGLIDGWHRLAAGTSHTARSTVVYTWDTPWSADATGQHQIYWQKQPGTASDAVKIVWKADGKTSTASSDLGVDRVIAVGPAGLTVGIGHAAQVELPKLSL